MAGYTFLCAEPVYAVAISPINPLILVTGGGDDEAHIWDLSGEGSVDIGGHTDSVASLAFSADGKLLACGSFDGYISIVDMDAIEMKGKLDGPTDGIQVSFIRISSVHSASMQTIH
jgi:angio-associated migratory cell protein